MTFQSKTTGSIGLLLATTLLAGCAVGPDYHASRPAPAAAAPFRGAALDTGTGPAFAAAPVEERWWSLYKDPMLDRLVEDALAANTDLRVAAARVDRARALLRDAHAAQLPTTGIDVSAQRERVPSIQTIPGLPRERWAYDGGLSLSYEVDLFGRVRRGIEAARGDAQAAQADADAMRLAVIADTVRAYFDVTTSAERVKVAEETVALLDRSIRITGARVDVGRSDRLDLIRVTALRDQQAATIPSLKADREAALLRLATLTGRAPQELPADVGTRTETPHLAQPIPVGDGAALLARRPDVRAAERRLAADTARIGVAVSDLYPRISLGGSGGFSSLGAMDVLGAGASRWAVGPLISWAFPNQAAVRARIGAAKADAKASLATFDGTVLTALEETERALSAYARAEERVETLARARDEAERAARISLARQREGQIDFLTVLDAERTLAGAEADLVAARRAGAFAQVDVFRALGGGWQQS
ncbi:RND efflux system, outer membrane lipoprotein, NodT family [Novosphingobium nitrogenifigens DSM 19370]|uniref:RND efflux system, outer membrane lipoprotein, NodT family n=1 Tax=Novosphingobium nitrogenifigens DSM 19370 TaxID=983920 RepID=F1Z4B6_9SPHN|nr:TolC family protein [Novosphingobium nitrogenifigens]EGD60526.1 RND efflux system, outer membrane lipoprotein, NodT family [Novosphingobium nitrogenifigens DSM 19370]